MCGRSNPFMEHHVVLPIWRLLTAPIGQRTRLARIAADRTLRSYIITEHGLPDGDIHPCPGAQTPGSLL